MSVEETTFYLSWNVTWHFCSWNRSRLGWSCSLAFALDKKTDVKLSQKFCTKKHQTSSIFIFFDPFQYPLIVDTLIPLTLTCKTHVGGLADFAASVRTGKNFGRTWGSYWNIWKKMKNWAVGPTRRFSAHQAINGIDPFIFSGQISTRW